MQGKAPPQRARTARDRGLMRLRRLTTAAIAGALGLSAVFAGVAASSTHSRKPVRDVPVRSVHPLASTPLLPPAQAPSLGDDSSPSPSPTPPASPPAASTSAPVAVSGGS
jgi:hypothetical protein